MCSDLCRCCRKQYGSIASDILACSLGHSGEPVLGQKIFLTAGLVRFIPACDLPFVHTQDIETNGYYAQKTHSSNSRPFPESGHARVVRARLDQPLFAIAPHSPVCKRGLMVGPKRDIRPVNSTLRRCPRNGHQRNITYTAGTNDHSKVFGTPDLQSNRHSSGSTLEVPPPPDDLPNR